MKNKFKKMLQRMRLFSCMLMVMFLFTGCISIEIVGPEIPSGSQSETKAPQQQAGASTSFSIDEVPEYSGSAYVAINNNVPYFTAEEMTDKSYEYYSPLDDLGRCGMTIASIGVDIMPTEKRGDIGSVKPTGWQSAKYDCVDGKYLYNRCHLIGFQLTGEDANKMNLITGTRYLNVTGMLPFENMVADYVKETENHVMYRVTPFFTGDNLVADGVLMEGKSVEDDGEDILFCVYCYNVQPGVTIDYATGESREGDGAAQTSGKKQTYILNTGSKKYHLEGCSGINRISDANKQTFKGTKQELEKEGYEACKTCKP